MTTADSVPIGHRDGPPLYGRMMSAIHSGHSFGNGVRMLKLPLIFVEEALYAGAISQFYLLTRALEAALEKHQKDPMVAKVRKLGLVVTPGYESDLRELYGGADDWQERAESECTRATRDYVSIVEGSEPVDLVAAAFILYGALVVGGGKQTQAKVRKVFPGCTHALFDVGDDMKALRTEFKSTYTAIGKEWPEHFERLEAQAARFMSLNNTVVLSVKCWGRRATAVALGAAAVGVIVVAAFRRGA